MHRMALYLQDKHPIAYELEVAEYAEDKGFTEIWQADTRLARDCVVLMSAILTRTKRLKVGSGVLPIWTRNPAVIAATWSTMWELAGKTADGESRVMCGIGAWWEPISSRVGRRAGQATRGRCASTSRRCASCSPWRRSPTKASSSSSIECASTLPTATARLATSRIYIGATGEKMMELTGEICDGAVLNYVVSDRLHPRCGRATGHGRGEVGQDDR